MKIIISILTSIYRNIVTLIIFNLEDHIHILFKNIWNFSRNQCNRLLLRNVVEWNPDWAYGRFAYCQTWNYLNPEWGTLWSIGICYILYTLNIIWNLYVTFFTSINTYSISIKVATIIIIIHYKASNYIMRMKCFKGCPENFKISVEQFQVEYLTIFIQVPAYPY